MSGERSTNLRSRREIALRAIGTTVGERWTLLGVIGSGGTSTVYEAVHRNGSRVAVKMLHTDFISHDGIRRRLLAEGYTANLVRHDGAVKVLDDGDTDEGRAYLVMELLEGETLAARLARNGPLPADRVLGWGIEVLDILAAAHEQRVVHRDVKPSNIFITHRGQVKLLDFGIARILEDSTTEEPLTEQGVAVGTPAFMAPEQAFGNLQEIGPTTDVWGVGATLFQLLTGRPVQDPKSNAAASSTGITPAPPVRAFAPSVPSEIARVIDRALSFRASDRWPSARAMIRALELAREALHRPTSGPETLTEQGVTVRKPALISGRHLTFTALGFVVTVASAFYWIATHPASPKQHVALERAVATAEVVPTGAAPARLATAEHPAATSSAERAAAAEARFSNTVRISPPRGSKRPSAAPAGSKPTEVAVQPISGNAQAAPRAASDMDAMLDRRK